MNIAKRSRLAVSAALVVAGAGIAAHVASSSGQSSNEAVAVLRPLDRATLPPGVPTAARASARAANIPPAAIDEAGVSAAGSPFRSTLIARRRGEMLLAFAAPDLVTSFRPVASALRGHRMLVLEGTDGTASSLREVGLSIVVERSIARVEVVDVDGGTVQLALTKWPGAPYASASVSATVPGDFPKIVRAFNAAGTMVAVHSVDLRPAHF
jgi:hypothetical protein